MPERLYFGSIEEAIEPPNLIEVQSKSYEDFLQKEVPASQRIETGLQAVLMEVFPITSYDETIELDFLAYDIEEPKATALESLQTGESFSASLYVTFKLKDETGTKKERVYMGELPMMTRRGTFVINGAERVIVSQLHRSPGICFEKSYHLNGKELFFTYTSIVVVDVVSSLLLHSFVLLGTLTHVLSCRSSMTSRSLSSLRRWMKRSFLHA